MGIIKRFLFYGIIAIMLFLSLKSAFAIQVELLESTDQCISCYSIYKITNDKSITPLSIDENTMWFEFRDANNMELRHAREVNKLQNLNVEIQDERIKEWTEQVLIKDNCQDNILTNGTERVCNPEYKAVVHNETIKYWKPFENKMLDTSKELIIKVNGDIKVNSLVDNVLVLKDETNTFIKYIQYAWWSSNWNNKVQWNTTFPVNQNDFPILLKTNTTAVPCSNMTQANGCKDLRILNGTETNELSFEFNNNVSTNLFYWVKKNTNDNPSYLYFNNTGANDGQNGTGVWNNYGAVWHLENLSDSTANANMLVMTGTVSQITGSVGKGYGIFSDSNYFTATDTASLSVTTGMTLEAVVNITSALPSNGAIIISKWYDGGTLRSYILKIQVDGKLRCLISNDNSYNAAYDLISSNAITSYVPQHYACVFNQTHLLLYKNGGLDASKSFASTSIADNNEAVYIGKDHSGANTYLTGTIDEIRISNVARSQSWINASWQQIQSNYNTYGSIETLTSPDSISYNTNYSTPVYELSNQSFWINLSWTGNISGVVATNLEYNNTNYSMTLLDNGSDWKRYNTSIIIPLTSGSSLLDENRTFKFFYNYTNTTGTYSTNTSTSLQRVMEAYFINSVSTTTNVPELSNATLVVNISQGVNANYSKLNWSVILEFNGTNHTITTSTLNNETFNYTELIGVVLTNNTRINHSAYLNLNWNGINASRGGFSPYNILLQNYFPITSTNGNISEGSTSITTVNIQNISGGFTTSTGLFNVSVIWNGTSYQATQLNTTAWQLNHTAPIVYNITNFTITGVLNVSYAGVSSLRNYSVGQYVYPFALDNCSTYTIKALNFSLFDEVSLARINGTLAGFFNITNTGKLFNLSWSSNTSFGLCISPNDANVSVMSQAEYASPGYVTRTYYMYDTRLDNVTDQVSLYLNTNASLVVLAVTDQDDSAVQDVYIYIQAYDITTNSFKTVQVVKTDFRGQAYPALTLYTQWYKFLLVYKGNTVLETDATKLLTSTLNFRISLVEDELASFTASHDVSCSVSWNNATKNFEFVFVNPASTDVTALLEVIKQDAYSTTMINSSTLTASSGTILVGIGSMENKTYVGKGTIDGYICGTPASTSFGGAWQQTGSNGLLLAILLLVAIVCIMSWSPTISIIALLVGVVLAFMMGILYMSWIPFISFLIVGGIAVYRLARGSSNV